MKVLLAKKIRQEKLEVGSAEREDSSI